MDKKVEEELGVYELMLKNWMSSELAYALNNTSTDWEFLVKDMYEKFWEWMFPKIARIRECGYVSNDEMKEYVGRMLTYIDNFRLVLESLEEEEEDE